MPAALPWPETAVSERDKSAELLRDMLDLVRHMKRVTRNGMEPNTLRQIGSDLHDMGSTGYRLLEKSWPFRWPKKANEAKEAAIDAFWDARIDGKRIVEIVAAGQFKYLRPEMGSMADTLSVRINDALTLLSGMGAQTGESHGG